MKKIIGPLIFLLVAGAIAYYKWFGGKETLQQPAKQEEITVSLFTGGEKWRFLHNPEIIDILKESYGITLDPVKAGSIEMVSTIDVRGKDALWPSNQIAVEMFEKKSGNPISQETIFNSPIVLYTYDIVADALIREKIVSKKDGTHYIVDFPKLAAMIRQERTWKDMGLPQLYGKVSIHTTDPTRSNSGNIFSGLLANMFNNSEVVTPQTLDSVLPDLKDYFYKRGYMEHSSDDIFKSFITTGVGAKPIIVGYENQLVEFALENEKHIDYLQQKIRILYPIPTVWSSHPIIPLTPKGKRLIEALKDERIQRLAWESHGFRSGLIGVVNDPAVLKVGGIPKEINAVIPMPGAEVMMRIIDSLSSRDH